MRKIGVVAASELGMAVRSKAFLVGLVLLPVFMGASALVQRYAHDRVETGLRRFAVVDGTGALYAPLAERMAARNALVGGRMAPTYVPERVETGGRPPDEVELELSDRVRRKELFAFVVIPAGVARADPEARLRYFSDHPTVEDLRQFVEVTVNQLLRLEGFRAAGVDEALLLRLDRSVPSDHLGLLTRGSDGRPVEPGRVDKVREVAVPVVLMFLLFIVVMTGAPQQLNTVLEEKMSRVSEVLLGSVTPFELMMGKLIGSAGVSLILASLYLGGGLVVMRQTGTLSALPLGLLPWFLAYLILAVFLFGSVFIAIGAACSDLKDTQNLMMPVMLFIMIPALTWTAVLRAPSSGLSVGMSLFPPATPFLMLLRMALRPGPPAWQVALGFGLVLLTTVACVAAAGKIFRVGLLMQGKSASLGEMLRWLTTK